MEGIEFEDKEGGGAVSVSGAFEAGDLVVDAFELSSGNREVEPVQDACGIG